MPALLRRGIAGISALDSRVDLIARATRRREHHDYILTRRPPTSRLEGHQMMTFRSRSSSSGSRPQVGTRAPEGPTQRSPQRAGSRPDDAEDRPDDGVLVVMVTASCPDPRSLVF